MSFLKPFLQRVQQAFLLTPSVRCAFPTFSFLRIFSFLFSFFRISWNFSSLLLRLRKTFGSLQKIQNPSDLFLKTPPRHFQKGFRLFFSPESLFPSHAPSLPHSPHGRLRICRIYGLSLSCSPHGRLRICRTYGLSLSCSPHGRLQIFRTLDSLSFPLSRNRTSLSSLQALCHRSHAQPCSSVSRPCLHLPHPLSESTPHPHKCVLQQLPGQSLPCVTIALR